MKNTHHKLIGYLLWGFGFTGSHRFYFGKPITGTFWFLTFGVFGVGWLIDIFLIPSLDKDADNKYIEGEIDYTICWLLLGYLGFLGAHRFYMKKWITGVLFLLTGGFLTLGWLYDLWTLNEQISDINSRPNLNVL